MGRISDEDVERVRNASDLAEIVSERVIVKQKGRNLWCCCPFHDEKTPSMQIRPELGTWHCFGCGEGGDVFSFVQKMENVDFPDAVRYLADRSHIELVEIESGSPRPRGYKDRLIALCECSADFYHANLMRSKTDGAATARSYLSSRGFGSDVSKRWMLGFAPGRGALVRHLRSKGFKDDEMIAANVALRYDNGQVRDRFYDRVMFPIRDRQGRVIAFGGRVVMGKSDAKYINSSDTPLFHKSANLYGLDRAKATITSEACAIVVEGYTDVISLHEAGVENVVAALGTALTKQHVKMLRSLRPKKILYLFDGDSAGQKAADRATEFIDQDITPESGIDFIEFLVAVLPDDMDPAEFVAARGKEGIVEVSTHAKPLIRFAIDRRLAKWDLSSPEQRFLALQSAVELLVPIKGSILAQDYANYIADALGCEYTTVSTSLAKTLAKQEKIADSAAVGADWNKTSDSDAARIQAPPLQEDTRAMRAEREVLSLVAQYPSLVSMLRKADEKLDWSDDYTRGIVSAFLDMPASTRPGDMIAAAESSVDNAAAYLAAGTIQTEDESDAAAKIRSLLCDIKEEELLKSIRLGNARLKNPAELTSKEYDNTFMNVSALQKELNKLRKARTGHNAT